MPSWQGDKGGARSYSILSYSCDSRYLRRARTAVPGPLLIRCIPLCSPSHSTTVNMALSDTREKGHLPDFEEKSILEEGNSKKEGGASPSVTSSYLVSRVILLTPKNAA